jgi:hypothetical protein
MSKVELLRTEFQAREVGRCFYVAAEAANNVWGGKAVKLLLCHTGCQVFLSHCVGRKLAFGNHLRPLREGK